MVRVPPPQPLITGTCGSGFLLYNFLMIHILAAIECEVSCLRDMVSDDLEIILTGIGKVNAAFACGRMFPMGLTRNDLKDDIVINIGICGARDLSGLFIVNKITDEATGRDFYPDIIRVSGIPEASLVTVDEVKTDPDPGVLYEMEASAIYQALSKLISPDRMIFLKVVSDSGYVNGITTEYVNDLIKSHLPEIKRIISSVREGTGKEASISNDDLYERLYASSSMRVQIDELIRYASSLGIDGRKLFAEAGIDEVSSRASGKEVVARVRGILTHLH